MKETYRQSAIISSFNKSNFLSLLKHREQWDLQNKIHVKLLAESPKQVGAHFLNIGLLYDRRLMINVNSVKGKAVVL